MSPRQTRRGAKSVGIDDTLSETASEKLLAETPAEKRKRMRSNAKSDVVNSALSDTISTKVLPSTPPAKQQKTRAKRQLPATSSIESDADRSPEMSKSKKRTVQETPSKTTRSRKKVLLDNTVIDDKEPIANVSKARRTRRGKENETSVDQSVQLDSTTMDESTANLTKSRGARARKKNAKKTESKTSDEDEVREKRTNASSAKNFTIMESSVDSTMNDSALPMSREDTEVLQVSSRISRLKAVAATVSCPAIANRRSRSVKPQLDNFTPESSPLTVNLSPHRTTKTPRKSPMNLGSPKSHADAPLRLSKTPRKLPVVVESPVPSEMSVTSSTHTTPEKSTKNKSNDSPKKKKHHKSPRSSEKSKKSPRRSSVKVLAVRKFSKSPKIVLRSPKKSKSSKSPRLSATKVKRISTPKLSTRSPHNRSKTPIDSPRQESVDRSRKSNSSKSPSESGNDSEKRASPSGARMSLHLARVDRSNTSKDDTSSSPTLRSKLSNIKLPTIVLNKLSQTISETSNNVSRSSVSRTLQDEEFKITPVKTPSAEKRLSQGGESPHRAKSTVKKRVAVTDSGTPLRPTDTPVNSPTGKLTGGKSMIISSSNTPVEIAGTKTRNDGARPMLSSTPRERIRRSLNLSPGLAINSVIVNSPMNGEVPAGSSTMISDGRSKRRSLRIDDESNPLISDDDSSESNQRGGDSRLDGTFEVDNATAIIVENEDEKIGNGTYDLEEPKTPHLRRKATKRSLGDMDTSVERSAKRTCRVRFASPPLNEDVDKTVGTAIGRSRSATPGHRTGVKRTPQKLDGSTVSRASKSTAAEDKSRRRSSSMTSVSSIATPKAGQRRSNSVSDVNARSAIRKAQLNSVNRLSKPKLSISSVKKPEVKTPVARKVPNFAQIHQKKFAEMESLVDAKKRVEKRHLAMNSQIPKSVKANTTVSTKPPSVSQPIAPVVAVNGAYNRYGFKLRKNDAMKIVAQKQPTLVSRKKQNDNRMLLKGVRTNRRFDLIMKARNINQT